MKTDGHSELNLGDLWHLKFQKPKDDEALEHFWT